MGRPRDHLGIIVEPPGGPRGDRRGPGSGRGITMDPRGGTMRVPRSGRRTTRGSPWIPRGACKTPGDRRGSTLGQPWILRALLGPRGSTLEAPWDYTGSPGETREPQRTPVGHQWVPVGTPWEHRGTTLVSLRGHGAPTEPPWDHRGTTWGSQGRPEGHGERPWGHHGSPGRALCGSRGAADGPPRGHLDSQGGL